MVSGEELVESSLHNYLAEHLNSEIALGTITDIAVAMDWLRSTFLYIRALKNPKHYGMQPNLTEREIESKLQAMCMRELHALENHDLVKTSNYAYSVEPTENGKLMARYYIAFDTMKVFMKVEGTENLPELLELLTRCHEFQDVQLRRYEKPILNNLNRHKGRETIRFPISGKITTKSSKANVLIQAVLGCLQIPDAGLLQESIKVMRLAERLLRGLTLYLGRKTQFKAYASALILHKCTIVKMWENSDSVCRQLPGIGPALSTLLVSAGKKSFRDIIDTDPRTLERIINRQPPMGNTLQEAALRMPQYDIDIIINETTSTAHVQVKILNLEEVQYGNLLHKFNLLLSVENIILRREVISDQTLIIEHGKYTSQTYVGNIINEATEITVTLISQSIVGVDVEAKLSPSSKIPSVNETICSRTIKPTSAKPQIDVKYTRNASKSIKPKQVSKSLDRYSFAPSRPKKMAKSETEFKPIPTTTKTNSAVHLDSTATEVSGTFESSKTQDIEVIPTLPSNSHLDHDNSRYEIVEILHPTSIGSCNTLKPSREQRGEERMKRKKCMEPDEVQATQISNAKHSLEPEEDLGFDVDNLLLPSSNDNLLEESDVNSPRPTTRNNDIGQPESIDELPTVTSKSHCDVSPLTQHKAHFDEIDEALGGLMEMDDRTSDMEDELDDSISEVTENVEFEIVNHNTANERSFNLITQSDLNEGFQFHEIPGRLRSGYNDVSISSERFGWRPPVQSQSTQENLMSSQSFVSQAFTAQVARSQAFIPYEKLIPRGSEGYGSDIHSKSASLQNIIVAPDSISDETSQDPRSLEYACRLHLSSSAFTENEDGHPEFYTPYDYNNQWIEQPSTVPITNCSTYPQYFHEQVPVSQPNILALETKNQTPLSYPMHQSMNNFIVQSVSRTSDFFDSYSQVQLKNHHPTLLIPESNSQNPRRRGFGRESQMTRVLQSSQSSYEPLKDKLFEVLESSQGHSHLPRPPVIKKRRTTSSEAHDDDSAVGSSVCTNLSSLMAIHGGYSKSLKRNES